MKHSWRGRLRKSELQFCAVPPGRGLPRGSWLIGPVRPGRAQSSVPTVVDYGRLRSSERPAGSPLTELGERPRAGQSQTSGHSPPYGWLWAEYIRPPGGWSELPRRHQALASSGSRADPTGRRRPGAWWDPWPRPGRPLRNRRAGSSEARRRRGGVTSWPPPRDSSGARSGGRREPSAGCHGCPG